MTTQRRIPTSAARFSGVLLATLSALFTLPAAGAAFQATGPWTPADPSVGGCGNFSAPETVIPINVSGMTSRIGNISLTMNFPQQGDHWGGDLVVVLAAPGGSPSFPIVGRLGATDATGVGDGSAWTGTYTFVDPSVSTANIWTAATMTPDGVAIPSGTYATTPIGGAGVAFPPAPTSLIGAFSTLSAAQINGQWTVRLRDTCATDTTTLSSVSLSIMAPNCYDIDDDGHADALTDGLMILRTMFGLSGTSVTNGALGAGARRTDPALIRSYMASCGLAGLVQ